MVKMKNIKQEGHLVHFDGYIDGHEDEHFTMTVDLNDSSKSVASIGKNGYTGMAMMAIMFELAREGKLPSELVAMTH
jgi:hypothetical protein